MTFDEAHRAIKRGDLPKIRAAIGSELDPNGKGSGGWTLLMAAAKEGNVPIGELLLAKGADVNTSDDWGQTPLFFAAWNGHVRFMEILIAAGAARNLRLGEWSIEEVLPQASGLSDRQVQAVLTMLSQP